ncbi:protein-glutamate O-methyltransferase CheR [Aliikangiella marina]|uniref:Chemotaxis protein methyltransferase n=1 Tax=Aliikangiella marina TaxID=1712262 RepID=A0A545TDN2_9GAMM|nr:protein-glutamate O-methyltransferase CheR [Aliikangiella marina]TQV75301.1 protein-glutamate O-methyltransferase CheR [Aliikangiella marina]
MEISSNDYQRFKVILEKQSGILLGDNKQYLVVSRLSNFIQEKGLVSMSKLLDQISGPSGRMLLKQVIDRMTTNETLWFRDKYPFDYLKSTIVPSIKKSQPTLRIWCAACSTGQEPYSIAMHLDEIGALMSTEIYATDLSERVIDKAKKGIYQQIELKRGMPQDKLKKFFTPHDGEDWQINTKLRGKVRFQPLNLLETPYRMGKFDVIYCRNVLIYFSNENKTKVINGLIDNLKPGGFLFLGASEALTRGSHPMKMVRCNPGLVYQKEA